MKKTRGILRAVPQKYFEIAGTVVGFVASASIASQVYAECTTDRPSTVSTLYAVGFLAIFLFWTLYGLRFGRAALWITNGVAVLMQAVLLFVILLK